MKLLLTNDDGIDAPGLAALLSSCRNLGDSIVMAPLEAHSGCSHRITLDKPLPMHRRSDRSYALAGTPADCVRIGLHALARDADWVFAGINAGGNLGVDVHYSGTVAAVREAVLHGKPGIAFSHYVRRGRKMDWERAAGWVSALIEELTSRPQEPGTFWNVNLPHLEQEERDPPIVFCPLDSSPLPLHYQSVDDHFHYAGDYRNRPRAAGGDIDVCFGGRIAVTKLTVL